MNTNLLKRFGLAALALYGATTFVGCGGAYDATAYGVVTLDGQTVPRGTVQFHPVSGGPAVYGTISDNGSYIVHTGRERGLPAGDYQVSITANEVSAKEQTDKGGPPPPGKAITPAWYRMKETSGLKYTVKPGKNEIYLELKSQPPAGVKASRAG